MAKKKKKKVIYYDDGSTISNMSGVGKPKPKGVSAPVKQKTTETKWQTYWRAVNMMIVPTLIGLGVLALLYLLLSSL